MKSSGERIREYQIDGWLKISEWRSVNRTWWELYGFFPTPEESGLRIVYEQARNHAEAKKMASMILAKVENKYG